MSGVKRGLTLVSVLLAFLSGCSECAFAQAPLPVTTVQDTVYTAGGTAASGTVLVSWAGFTTASGAVIPAGNTSVAIGTNGLFTVALAPNAGATPIGSYYTATFHLSDGTTSRQFWVVPVMVSGGGPVRLAAVQNQVLPTSVAMQTVSKAYVDNAIAAAVTGHPADATAVYVLKAGDTMTGPLVLPADPVSPNQAADKNYVDASIAAVASSLPVFGPSGTTHAAGIVPDPGTTAGATRYLREDGTWSVPAGGSSGGTMATQNASSVAVTGGSINGTTIGASTAAAGTFTNLTATGTATLTGVTNYNASGSTFTFTSGAPGNFPAYLFNDTEAALAFMHPATYFAPNAASGDHVIQSVGVAYNPSNSAYMGLVYYGAGSANNFGTLGLWGADDVITWYPNGHAGVGITSPPTAAWEVNGVSDSTEGYSVNGTAGVSCAAGTVSLTTLVVTNGIITHC